MTQKTNLKTSVAEEKLKDFARQLVKEKNFQGIEDPEIVRQLEEDLYERLEERVNAEILAALPAEKLEEFDRLLDTGSREEVSDFCEANIPNLQEVMTNALGAFRLRYLGLDKK